MALDVATVKKIAPELTLEDNSRIQYFIDEAKNYINSKFWKSKTDFAHGIYVAHLMSVARDLGSSSSGSSSSTGQEISSEKVGDLSVTYSNVTSSSSSNSTSSDNALSATKYGKLFLQLRSTVHTSPIII